MLCELCGEAVQDGQDSCPRCGFRFPASVHSDTRDSAILTKHDGKPADEIKKSLDERFSRYMSFFENLRPGITETEFSGYVDEAVAHMHLPVVIGIGDELNLSGRERAVIKAMTQPILDPGQPNYIQNIRTATLMKLSNALFCLGNNEPAMQLIDAAVQRNPNDDDALFNKAKLLYFAEDYEESLRFLEKVTLKNPERDDARYLAEMIQQLKKN